MKKYFAILTVIVPMLWQCTSGPSRTELNQMNDSLLIVNAQKEIQLNQLVETLGSIEENLQLIKEKENIISLRAEQGEMNDDLKNQINDDIKIIYDLMVENKNRIQELEKQMKNAGIETARLNKLIASLNIQLKEKNDEIIRLNEILLDKDTQIGNLSHTVTDLTNSLESFMVLSKQTQEELEEAQDLFHTAYYAVGTKKELRERNITDREGFLFFGQKKVLPEGFDKQYFNTIDVRNTYAISIAGKKVKLLTRHPDDSYELINDETGNLVLNILDIDRFWSITRYLVVQVN